MKPRILVVTVICVIAGLLGWFLYPSPADSAAKPAGTQVGSTKAEVSQVNSPNSQMMTPPSIPARPAQVAQPVAPAVTNHSSLPTSTPAAETFIAGPQPDLKSCIATTMHFLETQDILGLVKTIMPPDEVQQMIQSGQVSSVEDIAEHYRQMPDLGGKMMQLLQALQSVEGMEPEISADGTHATYKVSQKVNGPGKGEAPVGTPGEIIFKKVDGNWYLR